MKSWNTRLAISALLGGALPGLVLAQQLPQAALIAGGQVAASALPELATGQQGGASPAKTAPIQNAELKIKAEAITLESFGSLPVFGSHLFLANAARYISPTDLPVPSDYIVGVGDTVEIRLFGKENKVLRLPVQRDGSITIPELGVVSVVGLTLEHMGSMLLDRIAKQKIGVEATVSMGPLRSIQVFLMGDVNAPGAITTDGLATVSNALMLGGGIRTSGSMRRVEIRRQGKKIAQVDLYDTLLKGGSKGEIRLQSGDVVFVPPAGQRAAIGGEVQRPGVYELLQEKTAADLIRLAGGFTPVAYPQQSKLNRVGRDWQRSSRLAPLSKSGEQAIALQDGDIFEIPKVVQTNVPVDQDLRFPTVSVSGAVASGGAYAWREGMQLGDILGRVDQLDLSAYRLLAVIERLDPLTGTRGFLPVSLTNVLAGKLAVPLERDDNILILKASDVDFLSSAQVQQALMRKAPAEVKSDAAGVVVDSKGARGDAIELKTKREQGRNRLDGEGIVGQTKICSGLVELSHIISNEGTERFRSALFAGAYEADGSQLLKFVACPGIFEQTPRLLPFLLENSVILRGEIADPGVLPIAPKTPLSLALRARGGLTRTADSDGLEINKLVSSKKGTSVVRIHLARGSELDSALLEPGYVVHVRKQQTEQDVGLVRLTGQFAHPGTYEIKKGEKLSELITRAGGINEVAYPYGAVFLRQSVKVEKKVYYQKIASELQNSLFFSLTRMRATAGGAGEAAAAPVANQIIQQMTSAEPSGRMVVEADLAVLQSRPELDVVLEPGDEIHMPRRPSSIMVMGEVLNPGAVQFKSGANASDYIRMAGGLSRLADDDRIFAVLPNGVAEPLKVSSWNFQPKLLPPGSVIYVSREALPTSNSDLLMLGMQVIKDMAISAASLAVLNKN